MATEPSPPTGPGPSTRSPGAGVDFRRRTRVTDEDLPGSGSDAERPASSLQGETPGPDNDKPGPGRRRPKPTRDLLAAHRENQAIREALEAEVRRRRASLETECYPLLGAALFARRDDPAVADLYKELTTTLGARAKKKLEELGQILAISE